MTCGPTAGLDVPRGWAWLLSCALVSPRPWRGPESAVPVALPLCAWLALAQEREFWTSLKKGIPCGPGRPALEGATLGPVHVCLGELTGQRWPFCLTSPLHVCRYMCVCLCMHACVHDTCAVTCVHMHICACTHMCIGIGMCTGTCAHARVCKGTHVCIHVSVGTGAFVYICGDTCAQVRVHVCICVGTCVCVCCPWHFLRPLLGLLCGPTTSPHYLEWEMLPASGSF